MNNFSVLMSFYKKDDPHHLNETFNSLYAQELKASEIILIQDGSVSEALLEVVESWEDRLPLKRYVNQKNLGLGLSLMKGLQLCTKEFVARMDADDICHPKRFIKQVEFLENNPNVSVVGSWIAEFSFSPEKIDTHRILPSNPDELSRFAKHRCPLNHPSVMYRKSDILAVGGYSDLKFQQDYHLWGRLLNAGYKIANIPEILLYMRANKAMFKRRGGIAYFKAEMSVQKDFKRIGFIGSVDYYKNYMIRGGVRLFPNFLRKFFYQRLLR